MQTNALTAVLVTSGTLINTEKSSNDELLTKVKMIVEVLLIGCVLQATSGSHYFLATPHSYHAGESENIVITVQDLKRDAYIKITLDGKETTEVIRPKLEQKSLLVSIPVFVPRDLKSKADLKVSATGGLTFNEKRQVTIVQSANKIFIQTDKPMYKPGDKVQFRVVLVDKNLMPLQNPVLTEILVTNPSGSRIKQWTNVVLEKYGMVNLSMDLSQQPVQGDWKITVNYKNIDSHVIFKVSKYVLPKFEVKIIPPPYVLKSATFSVRVCAKYTYGKQVVGALKVISCYERKCEQIEKPIDGCTDVTITSLKEATSWCYFCSDVKINASVTETATGVVLNATEVSQKISRYPVQLEVEVPKYFKPGHNFIAKVRLTTPDGRPKDEDTDIQLTVSGKRQRVTVKHGLYVFIEKAEQKTSIKVTAEYKVPKSSSVVGDSATSNAWHSPSASYFAIGVARSLDVGKVAQVPLKFENVTRVTDVTCHYILVCRGKIALSGTQKIMGHSTRILFTVTNEMVPTCRLMVYYITDGGEFVSDFKSLHFREHWQNEVSLEFSENTKRPGDFVEIVMNAKPNSMFALTAVDRSVQLLGSKNDISNIQLLNMLKGQDTGQSTSVKRPLCQRKYRERCNRHMGCFESYSEKQQADGLTSIYETGLLYASNAEVATFCREVDYIRAISLFSNNRGIPGPSGSQGPQPEKSKPEKPAVKVRTEFPETWVWTDILLDEFTSEKRLRFKVPDTITTWYASGFALSPTDGIGVANPTSVKAFLPFFVSLSLPYSVIRGESVKLPTTVFNYLDKCLVIKLTLKPTDEFVIVGSSLTKLCVCGGKSKTFKFAIKPSKLGKVDVHVQAISIAPDQTVCTSNEIMESLAASDAVNKKLLVEPEGIKKELSSSTYFCVEPEETYKETLKLDFPKSIVPGSLYTTISVTGDLMGPTMDGLDKLLKMPYGCGEQNMINFAPNIYVMDYLTATGQVTDKIKSKATRFMESGYQRELTYKHTDGAYSAFGTGEGSTWLTAFVLRSYSQAQKYIFIDEDEISISKKWLLKLQMDNGCFEEKGMIHHKEMKGGVSGQVTMTAFVLAALLEAKIPKDDGRIKKAVTCMTNGIRDVTDPMHLAVVGYVLSLAESPKKLDVLEKLISLAKTDDGLIHWEAIQTDQPSTTHSYYRAPRPADIEMTAYALMMYINVKPTDKREHLRIVQWLAKQRNAYGGFSSTQDTCVGLQSLSIFSNRSFDGNYNLNVRTTSEGSLDKTFHVEDSNKLVLQRHTPIERVNKVLVTGSGQGCALVQASVKYNVDDVTDDPSFSLHVNVNNANTLTCKHDVKVCGSYLKGVQSNMALIDVTMVSGFEPILSDLDIQTQSIDSSLERYEFIDGVLTLYFEQFQNTSSCVNFSMEQINEVEDRKPAAVKIYDYYDPDDQATFLYKVVNCPEITNVA